ncbi:MAG: hypothetical protein LC732_05715 [Acidobacteria bacterium]|nr:hypothetical protein [Acidobacteriota bacterium]
MGTLRDLSVEALLERAETHRVGEYYQLWRAIAEKVQLRDAAPIMMNELEHGGDFQSRYHCALALLSMLPYTGIRPHDLAERQAAGHEIYMGDLREELSEALGGDL